MPGILPTPHMLESLCTAQLLEPPVHDVVPASGFSNPFQELIQLCNHLVHGQIPVPAMILTPGAGNSENQPAENILPGSLSGSPANISDETKGWRPTLAGHFES